MSKKRIMIIISVLLLFLFGAGYLTTANFQNQTIIATEHIMAFASEDTTVITEDMIKHLPDPVQLWLTNSGVIGKENIHRASLKQRGKMRLRSDQETWISSEAVQYFTTDDPAFVWSVKMKMNGIPVAGRDLFIDGTGEMLIKAGGVFTVAHVSDHPKVNQPALQRYLGEIVWFPTAALIPGISWEPLDELSAKATMTVGETSGSAIFYFTPEGDLDKFVAWRYKETDHPEPTEWVATVRKTEEVHGIRIPTELEAAWVEEGEAFTWYVFEIYDVVYNG